MNILNGKCIGVIGKRVPSEYGSNITDKIVCDLVKNEYTIVSGMALGIDTLAHRSALKNKGKTVAVLGSGINYCYPKRNQDLYAQLKGKTTNALKALLNLAPKKATLLIDGKETEVTVEIGRAHV